MCHSNFSLISRGYPWRLNGNGTDLLCNAGLRYPSPGQTIRLQRVVKNSDAESQPVCGTTDRGQWSDIRSRSVMRENALTLHEFLAVRKNLEDISTTWADLWTLLCLTRTIVTRLIRLKYQDIHDDVTVLRKLGKFAEKRLSLSPAIRKIVVRRRTRFQNDIAIQIG